MEATRLLHEELTYAIIGAAMEVHRILGPGFLEAVHQAALAQELRLRGIRFTEQKSLSVMYKGVTIGEYVADFLVEDCVILELKAVTMLNGNHKAQAINYLAATGLKLALLLNFGAPSLQHERLIH
jgi:GxxExxY protein